MRTATLEDAVRLYADLMQTVSGAADPRLGRVFESVPRENFVPPGPWTIMCKGGTVRTPTDDPIHLYQNVLVVLDADKGINNGEPFLHASWIGAAAPAANETVVHVGTGGGYYTALLAMLVLPKGQVFAYEIDAALADAAKRNLESFANATVACADAVRADLPPCDVLYVNAGVVAPPVNWLHALRPGGRMIFPWRPSAQVGVAGLVTRRESGFAFKPVMPAYFIPCVGASPGRPEDKTPDFAEAWQSASLHITADEVPDDSATAIYADVWFSRTPI